MLKVSSSKSLASESKGFAFWVKLVAPDLPSADYLSYHNQLSNQPQYNTKELLELLVSTLIFGQ
ncbi:hypothetical protein H5410_013624 [Solanum commersonii]|uniref:Uncharacterized protein n=1 Tax=Solanum commersonii TaxID=4109 RepID=A0A9J5ZNR1_SOLCO|nr:hypothetical protein H5410_013624 [Solanum commersonii]